MTPKNSTRLFTTCALLALPHLPAAVAFGPADEVKDETAVDLRGFGLSFPIPDGWRRQPEVNYAQLARLARVTDRKLSGLLELQTVAPKGRSARDVAVAMAAELGGDVADHGTVDGEPAGTVEFSIKPAAQFPARRAAVFPANDELVIVQAGAATAADLDAAFKAVMAGVAIKPPAPAADDLGVDRKRPVVLFDSAVFLPLPEPFRPDKVKDATKQMFFGVRDWATGHDDCSLQVQRLPNPDRKPLKDVTDAMAERLSAKLSTPVAFTKVNDAPEAYVSNPFPPTGKDVQRVVQVKLDDDHVAVLIFRSMAADPAVRAKYMDAVEAIAKAARTSADYQAARRAAGDAAEK